MGEKGITLLVLLFTKETKAFDGNIRNSNNMNGIMIIGKWFWVVAILANLMNVGFYYARARREIAQKPELAASYPRLICAYMIWMNVPWIVMGTVMLAGGAGTLFDFLEPRDSGFGVKLFYGSVTIAWLAALYWILFRDGDMVLSRHKAFFSWYMPSSPYAIRLAAIFMAIIGALVFCALWSGHVSFNFHE